MMFEKTHEVLQQLSEIKELILKIVLFPRTLETWWNDFRGRLWTPLEIATCLVMLGMLVAMVDRRIGYKIVRYIIIGYFVLELALGLTKGR